MFFLNHEAAYRYFRTWLLTHNFYEVSCIVPQNKGRHAIMSAKNNLFQDNKKVIFYCVFKKSFFWKFPELYQDLLKEYPSLNGAGESVNADILEEAEKNEMTLIFIYPNGAIYNIEPHTISQLHKRALTIRKNGLMRTQDKTNEYVVKYANGVKENVNETTYVFPVKLMMNLERMNFINYEGGD